MLQGKTAIVTGSTSGIGLGIAEALAAQGCRIVLNGLGDATEIEDTRRELAESKGVDVAYDGADMTRPDEIAAMVKGAAVRFGSADILVNNAGIQHTSTIEAFPRDRWDAVIAINLSAIFHATQAALHSCVRRVGAVSSTWRRPTVWWRRPTNQPMSQPSTAR